MNSFLSYCAKLAHYVADNVEFTGNLLRSDIVGHYTKMFYETGSEQAAYELSGEIVSAPIATEPTPTKVNTTFNPFKKGATGESLQEYVERTQQRKRRNIQYNSRVDTRGAFYQCGSKVMRAHKGKCYRVF